MHEAFLSPALYSHSRNSSLLARLLFAIKYLKNVFGGRNSAGCISVLSHDEESCHIFKKATLTSLILPSLFILTHKLNIFFAAHNFCSAVTAFICSDSACLGTLGSSYMHSVDRDKPFFHMQIVCDFWQDNPIPCYKKPLDIVDDLEIKCIQSNSFLHANHKITFTPGRAE